MSTMKAAANILLVSALLHVAGWVLSGFSAEGTRLVTAVLPYLLLCAGLMRGIRWVAWLTFLLMFFGMATAIALAFGGGAVPAPLPWAIAVADGLVALTLLAALWQDPSGDSDT